ncbi:hypothetical protein [Flavobacterium sp.]|jgi:hypothetical protein|uniref:hypothetical protein n=1 Tax=Flavobacterium sp. TaxID=239 RepID=UPI0037BEDD41
MKELDLLKKAWKKDNTSFEQLSEGTLYSMIHKRSSSIVKWILIISILEFIVLRGSDLLVLLDEKYKKEMNLAHLYGFEVVITIINFIVLTVFIALFYKNFKVINTGSSTKKLMKDILNTRKIVKYYVWYNLLLVAFSSTIAVYFEIKNNSRVSLLYSKHESLFIVVGIAIIAISILLFWLFYKLLYGILLNKLNTNYKELSKIELEE